MSVNDIETDEERNPQSRLLDGQTLHLEHVVRTDHIEQVTDRAGNDGAAGSSTRAGPVTAYPPVVIVSCPSFSGSVMALIRDSRRLM